MAAGESEGADLEVKQSSSVGGRDGAVNAGEDRCEGALELLQMVTNVDVDPDGGEACVYAAGVDMAGATSSNMDLGVDSHAGRGGWEGLGGDADTSRDSADAWALSCVLVGSVMGAPSALPAMAPPPGMPVLLLTQGEAVGAQGSGAAAQPPGIMRHQPHRKAAEALARKSAEGLLRKEMALYDSDDDDYDPRHAQGTRHKTHRVSKGLQGAAGKHSKSRKRRRARYSLAALEQADMLQQAKLSESTQSELGLNPGWVHPGGRGGGGLLDVTLAQWQGQPLEPVCRVSQQQRQQEPGAPQSLLLLPPMLLTQPHQPDAAAPLQHHLLGCSPGSCCGAALRGGCAPTPPL